MLKGGDVALPGGGRWAVAAAAGCAVVVQSESEPMVLRGAAMAGADRQGKRWAGLSRWPCRALRRAGGGLAGAAVLTARIGSGPAS